MNVLLRGAPRGAGIQGGDLNAMKERDGEQEMRAEP